MKFYLQALLVMLFVASAPALAQQGARRNNTVTSRQENKAERKQEKVNEVQKPTNVTNQPATDQKMRTAGGTQSDRRNGSNSTGNIGGSANSGSHSGSGNGGSNNGNVGHNNGNGGYSGSNAGNTGHSGSGNVNVGGGNRPPVNNGSGNGGNAGGNRPPANTGNGGHNNGNVGHNNGNAGHSNGNVGHNNGNVGHNNGNGGYSGGTGNRPPVNNGNAGGYRPPVNNGGYNNGNYPGGYSYPGSRPKLPTARVYDRAQTVYRTNCSSVVLRTNFRTKEDAYRYVEMLLRDSDYTIGTYGNGYSWLQSDVTFIPTPFDWTNPMTHNQFRIKVSFTRLFGYVRVTISGEWRESILSTVFSALRFQPSDSYSTYYAWNVLEDLADSIPHSSLSYR